MKLIGLFPSLYDLRLSLRNTLRHRARTAIAISAVGFGVVALLLAGGFINWSLWALRESTIESRLGHIQIVRPGFIESGAANPFFYRLPDNAPELRSIAAMPHVKAVAPRVGFSGLISHGETTMSFIGEGVDAQKEEEISRGVVISQGSGLSVADPKGIIVGEGLAANLGIGVGDKVVLLANTASGGVNGVEVRVRGLFSTFTKAFDDAALRVPIATAQELLRTNGAHSWVLLLDKTENTDAVMAQLKKELDAGKLQFIPWFDLADFYNKTAALFSRQVYVVYVIIALVIVLSISNTLIMSVLERTGEIGTLMATGTTRKKIQQMFVSEGVILGMLGGAIGVLFGIILAQIISYIGIPLPPPPGSNRAFTGQIMVTFSLSVTALAIAVGTTLLASFYPAWKASRLTIVDALRHNR